MTLEFEKLTADLEKMAQTTGKRLAQRQERVAEVLDALTRYRTNWTAVSNALTTAKKLADEKFYRSARPFDHGEPLDSHIPAPAPPPQATIIAADGSQIMPDRHAAHLYYLINVGGIVYHHGSHQTPDTFSEPEIFYPETDEALDKFTISSGVVSIERDVKEIATLAQKSGGKIKRKILITPGMVELGPAHTEAHETIGRLAGQVCDVALVVNGQRIPSFLEGFKATGGQKELHEVASFAEAQSWVAANRQDGDAVLIENDLPDLYERKLRL